MAGTISSVKALINGQEYTLTLNTGTGKYEAQGIAPAASSFNLPGGFYPVEITAAYETGTTATVNANTEGAIGEACRLVVKEKIKPVAVITYPTQGQYITSELKKIEFTVLDNASQENGYSGINPDSIVMAVSGANIAENVVVSGKDSFSITETDGGYLCVFNIPSDAILPDGAFTVSINVSDNDGNAADTVSVTSILDTAPPELSVTAPAEGLSTANNRIIVSGKTSDVTSAPVTLKISVNGEDTGNVAVNEDGSFSKEITLTSSGNQVIVIIATDAAGKSSSVTRNVYFSADLPEFKSVTIIPNPADGGTTFTITVEVE